MVYMLLTILSCSEPIALNANIVSPSNKSAFETNESIPFQAEVVFTQGKGEINFSWFSSKDGIFNQDSLAHAQSSLSEGFHTIIFEVKSYGGGTATDSISMVIGQEYIDPPSIALINPSNGTVLANSPSELEFQATDQQDNSEELWVDLYLEEEILCDGAPLSSGSFLCELTLELGSYDISAVVRDSEEYSSTLNASIEAVSQEDFDKDQDGHTPSEGDCDDVNANTFPNAPELCDGIDNDCDESTPIDVGSECYDDDGDGYCEDPPCLNSNLTEADCNDEYPQVNPDAQEIPNGIDDDCDGAVDEGTVHYDDDGDGYCELPPCSNSDSTQADCLDSDPTVSPAADELCSDGLDNDCSGIEDDENAIGCTEFFLDTDGDTFGSSNQTKCFCDDGSAPYTGLDNTDCYDENPEAHPLQTEFFTEDRGDGSFDYNCSGQEELELEGEGDGCNTGLLTALGLQCEANGVGWQDGEKSCGESGFWIEECAPDIPVICLAICAITGNLAQCLECGAVCLPDLDYTDQRCR